MLRSPASSKLFAAFVFTSSLILFASSTFCQSPSTLSVIKEKELAGQLTQPGRAAADPTPNKPNEKAISDDARHADLQTEVDSLKAENAAVRELLQKMAEQQRALLEHVERLQQRLDGANAATSGPARLADGAAPFNPANAPASTSADRSHLPRAASRFPAGVIESPAWPWPDREPR